MRWEWSTLCSEDAQVLFNAQCQLLVEHERLSEQHFEVTSHEWKSVLGYPEDDSKRLAFIKHMISGSTRLGDRLHCLKLLHHEGMEKSVAGFIDFEVTHISDQKCGKMREIKIRNIIVSARMRRQGCGKMLYEAMLEYLGPGEVDVIQLNVVDLNTAAMSLYFKLGFRITQRFIRLLGSGLKVVLLVMQALQGVRLNPEMPDALPLSLQDMPKFFKQEVVGEVVYITHSDAVLLEKSQRARIEGFDKVFNLFTLRHLPWHAGSCGGPCVLRRVNVNEFYACGNLRFERPASICLNKGHPLATAACDTSTWNSEHTSTTGLTDEDQKFKITHHVVCPLIVLSKIARERSLEVKQGNVGTKRGIVLEQLSPPRKRARGVFASPLLRFSNLRVYPEGKIRIGLGLDELGFVVKDTASDVQPELHMDDVIIAVGRTSMISDGSWGEASKELARAKLKSSLSNTNGFVSVVVGNSRCLQARSVESLRQELKLLID
jgi:ribosomal protein S18 acetylase RimI-like enzyme